MNTDEFLRGQQDCIDGKPHTDQGKDYNDGYAAQYELEQARSHGSNN